MKNFILSIAATLCFAVVSFGQSFEGKITQKIEFDNLPAEMEAYRSMLPSKTITYFKGDLTKVEVPTMMGSQIIISSKKNNTTTLYMDMMGKKIKKETALVDNGSDQNKPEVKKTKETKMIAGYKCYKVILSVEGTEMEMYITDEIPNAMKDKVPGIDGFPMEFSMSAQGMDMLYSVSKVEKRTVTAKEIAAPEGYKELTPEEQEQFSKQMGGLGL